MLKSAKTIASHLSSDKYAATTIDITPHGWEEIQSGNPVDLNTFCLVDKEGRVLKKFQFAFIIIHGTPAEDGKIQGYLEMMGIHPLRASRTRTKVRVMVLGAQKY